MRKEEGVKGLLNHEESNEIVIMKYKNMRTTIVFKNAILRINFHVHFVYVLTVQPAIEASTFSGRYSFMNMSAQSK